MPTIESTSATISRPSQPTSSFTFISMATPAPAPVNRSGGSSAKFLQPEEARGSRIGCAAAAASNGSEPPPNEETGSINTAPSFDITDLGPLTLEEVKSLFASVYSGTSTSTRPLHTDGNARTPF
ncbi:hypothetical protein BD410DRAFT_844529 [Rickenella mellea]|uniref:Uncharacterized protein n=1 Tax=Rickenella mellea TaxID=50990 RepID=A0A4Y7PLJ8_9AGAM|nr:hypothetical protein BD410DRAFT_844529 [Rickenella mellea]